MNLTQKTELARELIASAQRERVIPTPRTDAMRIQALDNDTLAIKTLETVHASFSRVLERELGSITSEPDENGSAHARIAWWKVRADELNEQVAAEREKVKRLVEINEFVGSAQLKVERAKSRALRLACESICEEWGENHDANPIGAGGRMYTAASAALTATEDAP